MDKFRIERELNHTYLILDSFTGDGDYKERMLLENNIQGLLTVKKRFINAVSEEFIDISGLQSLEEMFLVRDMQKADVKKLSEAIRLVGEAAAEFFIDEENILLSPNLIFFDIAKESYRFICYPVKGAENKVNDNIKTLLLFLMQHIENEDDLIRRVYSAYGYSEAGKLTFSSLYELLADKSQYEDSEDDGEMNEPEEKLMPVQQNTVQKLPKHYLPSFKEWVALLMCFVGFGLIGYEIYMSMLL